MFKRYIAISFRWLDPPSTLIRHESGAFGKRSLNRKNLKTGHYVLAWTETILKTEFFQNDDVTIKRVPQTQIQTDRNLFFSRRLSREE